VLKISKTAADYEPVARADDKCRQCQYFRRFDAPYSCEKVEGVIAAGGWCRLFRAKGRMVKAFAEAKK
jgi:hypothetical protein